MLSTYVKRVKSALKRSFEVEEADSSTHASPLSRRTTNPLRSSSSSTSSQRSYDLSSRNSDYSSSSRTSPSEPYNPRSPKTGMRRVDLSGGRNPDAASGRRTEISIEVSSKQIDSSPSAGIARFGLKRPEVGLNSRSNPPESGNVAPLAGSLHRRAELNVTRPQEPPAPPRRTDSQPSAAAGSTRIPEPPQQKRPAEPATPSPTEVSSRRPEMPVFRQQDHLLPVEENNNNNHHSSSSHPPPVPCSPLPTLAEPRGERVQSPVSETPSSRPAESEYLPAPCFVFPFCFGACHLLIV
ncbi:hypothetical protein NHX12_031731 [Muraenolepis orangiensis]|uniref:Uncharacterized protein n=1 Tax=Muraenolepis orangiensis TaxID=630683 RepID=A0A9Q0E5U3_9TELE|nr:hypothetical protein NHX12_031731 [Muraenolepis orangiensis]